jgi:hypothetical protein
MALPDFFSFFLADGVFIVDLLHSGWVIQMLCPLDRPTLGLIGEERSAG